MNHGIFTPRTRGQIVQALGVYKRWKGTRRGVKVRLELSPQPDFNENRVRWHARISGVWEQGKATSGSAALDQIEAKAAKR